VREREEYLAAQRQKEAMEFEEEQIRQEEMRPKQAQDEL
jgi:hypothetical protein